MPGPFLKTASPELTASSSLGHEDVRPSLRCARPFRPRPPATSLLTTLGRLMSDYEVTLVNDNSTIPISHFPSPPFTPVLVLLGHPLTSTSCSVSTYSPSETHRPNTPSDKRYRQEFYVRFKGPAESQWHPPSNPPCASTRRGLHRHSTIRGWHLEGARRAARHIPVQVAQYRLHEPHLPPKH